MTITGKLDTMFLNMRKTRLKPALFGSLPDFMWSDFLPVSISFRGKFTRRTKESQTTTLIGGHIF